MVKKKSKQYLRKQHFNYVMVRAYFDFRDLLVLLKEFVTQKENLTLTMTARAVIQELVQPHGAFQYTHYHINAYSVIIFK